MRAALRTPWRVSGFDPATVVRHTTKSAPAPLNRFYSTSLTTVESKPSSRSLASPKNRSTTPRKLCTRGRVLPLRRHYSSEFPAQETASNGNNGKKQSGHGRSRKKTYLIIGGALGVAAIVYSDEVRHLYRAAARTGRVVSALTVCINE